MAKRTDKGTSGGAIYGSSDNSFGTFNSLALDSLFILGRVISIVLDESHPRFEELGGWNALGTIEFDNVSKPTPRKQQYPTARPLDSSQKSLPLLNELVYILALPDTNIGEIASQKRNYYVQSISVWNHPHHNAFPENSNILPDEQRKDYVQTTAGSVRRVTDKTTEIDLGVTFKEKGDIHPLLPFEGDRILEGRWGNSVRFSSTIKNPFPLPPSPNTWSEGTSKSGDPIILIRNGQGKQTDEGWVPTIEDINNDDSSIYLTTTQKIPLNTSSTSYKSYSSSSPTIPNQYSGKQIILNSGRLVLNTTEDHLLLSSKKTVNINAISAFTVDAPQSVIQSNSVLLGGSSAVEPVLKGDTTIDILVNLIDQLQSLAQVLTVVTPTTVSTLNPIGVSLNIQLANIKTSLLTTTKSKITKTL